MGGAGVHDLGEGMEGDADDGISDILNRKTPKTKNAKILKPKMIMMLHTVAAVGAQEGEARTVHEGGHMSCSCVAMWQRGLCFWVWRDAQGYLAAHLL